MRDEFRNSPESLALIDPMQRVDELRAAQRMGASTGPRETSSYASSTLHRAPGFDDPQIQMSRDLKQAVNYLREITKHMADGLVQINQVEALGW